MGRTCGQQWQQLQHDQNNDQSSRCVETASELPCVLPSWLARLLRMRVSHLGRTRSPAGLLRTLGSSRLAALPAWGNDVMQTTGPYRPKMSHCGYSPGNNCSGGKRSNPHCIYAQARQACPGRNGVTVEGGKWSTGSSNVMSWQRQQQQCTSQRTCSTSGAGLEGA